MYDLDAARELVRIGDYDSLSMLYDDIPDTLSQLIRTAFIAKPGYKFYVADFSAIEARVIAHLARESWRAEVFKNGGDIYCTSASQMFHLLKFSLQPDLDVAILHYESSLPDGYFYIHRL